MSEVAKTRHLYSWEGGSLKCSSKVASKNALCLMKLNSGLDHLATDLLQYDLW